MTNANNQDAEHVDVDKILGFIIEEYFEARKKNFKVLAKSFSKFIEAEESIYSLDDIKTICSEITKYESPITNLSYAKEFTYLRVFAYALTATKNTFEVDSKDFMLSCIKYGIDVPFPFITKKNVGNNTNN